jgi:hypothetical protein
VSYVVDLLGKWAGKSNTASATGTIAITTNPAANGIIDCSSALFQTVLVAPGDVGEVTGGLPVNRGFFTVLEIPLETRLIVHFTFTPTSNRGSAKVWKDPRNKVASVAVTGAWVADNRIRAVGAGFLMNGVVPGDVAFIELSAANTGFFIVEHVPDNDNLDVQTIDEAAQLFTAGGPDGTVTVSHYPLSLLITDEATVTAAAIAAGHPLSWPSFQSGGLTGGVQKTVYMPRTSLIEVTRTGATDSVWLPEDEVIVMNQRDAFAQHQRPYDASIRRAAGDAGEDFKLALGRAGSDRFGASHGSAMFGWDFPIDTGGKSGIGLSGSVFHSDSQLAIGNMELDLVAAMFMDSAIALDYGPVTTGIRSDGLAYFSPLRQAIIVLGAHDVANLLDAGSGGAGVVTGVGSIEGLLKSADAPSPMWTLLNGTLTVIDPRENYVLAELFNIPSAGLGTIVYTFDPRFVERTSAGIDPVPIQGLTVRLWQKSTVLGEVEVPGSPFTTDASGRIVDGSGDPVRLTVATSFFLVFQRDITATHRIHVSGANYRFVNAITDLRQKFEADFPIDTQQPPFEAGIARG